MRSALRPPDWLPNWDQSWMALRYQRRGLETLPQWGPQVGSEVGIPSRLRDRGVQSRVQVLCRESRADGGTG